MTVYDDGAPFAADSGLTATVTVACPAPATATGAAGLAGGAGYELGVILKMGYGAYFLIVADFVRFAREQGIATTCRGSAPGSIVTYALGITPVDPLHYDLPFERFLNEDRVTMPDIDIDFEDGRREEVIRYVAQKYGESQVAQIITFGTMAARAAIRDVGRVLGKSYGDVDRLAKAVPDKLGTTLSQARKDADFKALAESSDYAPLVSLGTYLLVYRERGSKSPK